LSQYKWSQAEDGKEWDDFVSRNGGSVFHTWAWKSVRESAEHRSLYLLCRNGEGQIVAACPFSYRRTRRYLFYLESLHASPIGGPIVESKLVDPSEAIKMLQKSVKFTMRNPVVSLQLRVHQQPLVQTLAGMGYHDDHSQGLFVLDLESKSLVDIWSKGFEKHDRQAVKFYEGHGSTMTFASNEDDLLNYVSLHQETMRRVGELPKTMEHFIRMQSHLDERLKIALVTYDNKLIAGFTMICDAKSSTVYLGLNIGYSKMKNMHSPMIFINWRLVNWASENGFRFVNFGRTDANSNDPIHRIKQRFSSEFVPVHRFVLPTSVSYSVVKSIDRIISRNRRSDTPDAGKTVMQRA
jgi:CelD/BcsL family acetyltransferase involved in cellulose biosynthesis